MSRRGRQAWRAAGNSCESQAKKRAQKQHTRQHPTPPPSIITISPGPVSTCLCTYWPFLLCLFRGLSSSRPPAATDLCLLLLQLPALPLFLISGLPPPRPPLLFPNLLDFSLYSFRAPAIFYLLPSRNTLGMCDFFFFTLLSTLPFLLRSYVAPPSCAL
jgi:hypothetical protein